MTGTGLEKPKSSWSDLEPGDITSAPKKEEKVVSAPYLGDIIELPPDLEGVDPVNDQDKFVDIMVDKWNSIVTHIENQTVLFSKLIVRCLDGQTESTITEIVDKIRDHPNIKLTISRHRI